MSARGTITVVGLGPGDARFLTPAATEAIERATDLIGYGPYVDRVPHKPHQRRHASDNRVEVERAQHAFELAMQGCHVAVVSGGDPGVFAMASAVFEALDHGDAAWRDIQVNVEPGITAMLAAAARIGAPLGGDFCAMSLSDNLKPWDVIEKRLDAALTGDFVIALYNPISKARPWQLGAALKRASAIREPETPIVFAQAVGRSNEAIRIMSLAKADPALANMATLVIIGASTTKTLERPGSDTPYVYTPRSYGMRT
ncbi:precorrin-3B C(17)-methyltransferase [Microvirga sp. 2MCAF38]|uniref:precorrin-3B C(17)-methyltransferase n=1 Tax=Microvirga sp. 2MCAF38 TaxID=3232989 RepID=UPI003F95C02B